MVKLHYYAKNKTNLHGEAMTGCGITGFQSTLDKDGKFVRLQISKIDMTENKERVNCKNCKRTYARFA
jgi:hypothetical protein